MTNVVIGHRNDTTNVCSCALMGLIARDPIRRRSVCPVAEWYSVLFGTAGSMGSQPHVAICVMFATFIGSRDPTGESETSHQIVTERTLMRKAVDE